MNMQCHFCKKKFDIQGKVSRNENCPYCSYDIHCCLNCRFYSESKHNNCMEPRAEWVSDSERRNYCEYFEARTAEGFIGSAKDEKEEALKRAESLFEKK